jgi:hypothetical protein
MSAPISVAKITMKIPEDVVLSTGLAHSSKKVTNVTCVRDYLGMLSSADNPTSEGRAASFVSYSASKVQVEFEIISRKLRQNIVESVARDKHGPEGVRILRLLSHTGKMDEKQVRDSPDFPCLSSDLCLVDIKNHYDGSQGCSTVTRGIIHRFVDKHSGSPKKRRSQPSPNVLLMVRCVPPSNNSIFTDPLGMPITKKHFQ